MNLYLCCFVDILLIEVEKTEYMYIYFSCFLVIDVEKKCSYDLFILWSSFLLMHWCLFSPSKIILPTSTKKNEIDIYIFLSRPFIRTEEKPLRKLLYSKLYIYLFIYPHNLHYSRSYFFICPHNLHYSRSYFFIYHNLHYSNSYFFHISP